MARHLLGRVTRKDTGANPARRDAFRSLAYKFNNTYSTSKLINQKNKIIYIPILGRYYNFI